MTRRQIELAIAKTAGYENDKKTFTRLVVERRSASYAALLKAWEIGAQAAIQKTGG